MGSGRQGWRWSCSTSPGNERGTRALLPSLSTSASYQQFLLACPAAPSPSAEPSCAWWKLKTEARATRSPGCLTYHRTSTLQQEEILSGAEWHQSLLTAGVAKAA